MNYLLLIFTLLLSPYTLYASDHGPKYLDFKHKHKDKILLSLSPPPKQTAVSPDTIIQAVFSEKIDIKSIKKNTIVLKKISGKKEKIKGSINYSPDNKIISFLPDKPLDKGIYKIRYKHLKIKYENYNRNKPRKVHKRYTKDIEYTFEVSEQPDIIAPVITLNGNNPITIIKGNTYTEEGAVAIDEVDGQVNVIITSNVDISIVGYYTISYSAMDSSGNNSAVQRFVEVIEPPVVLESVELRSTQTALRVSQSMNLSLLGFYSDGASENITNQADFYSANPEIISVSGNAIEALAVGSTSIYATIGNKTSNSISITINKELDTSNFSLIDFGSMYTNSIPGDSTKDSYNEKLFCMVTGKILAEDGTPLSGVKVVIHNHPEYGSLVTDNSGEYAFAAEGGTYLTMRYSADGFTTIDRKIYAPIKEWSVAPNVTMLQIDTKVTSITLGAETPQVHTSTPIIDDRGTRSTTLVFNNVSNATVTSVDGSTRNLTEITVCKK